MKTVKIQKIRIQIRTLMTWKLQKYSLGTSKQVTPREITQIKLVPGRKVLLVVNVDLKLKLKQN